MRERRLWLLTVPLLLIAGGVILGGYVQTMLRAISICLECIGIG